MPNVSSAGPARSSKTSKTIARGPNRAPSAFHGKPSNRPTPASTAVVVFGLDENGKPKAGRFAEKQAEVARKAARSLKLAICNLTRPKLSELAAQIPVGRIHAQGKAFIPYIKRELFDQLAAAASPASANAASKASPSVSAAPAKEKSKVYIALGFDDRHIPHGARFVDPDEDRLIKVAGELKLNLYELRTASLIALAESLPVGKLGATGPGSVPKIKQILYSEIVSGISDQDDAVPRGKMEGFLPARTGLPESWDDIAVGHLVIAQECPAYGWAEAIVIDRKDKILTLRYLDYPKLPRFYRNIRAVALLSQKAA
jgi:hypothetical protein